MNACTACGAVIPELARFCPSCAAPADVVSDERERKLATIVFADLVDSTALGGSQDPERTRALLERFYDAMGEEINATGGTVEKYVGDAVVAVFGAPASLEDHAERALHVALAMQRRMRELFGESLGMRIGVNTGEVVVGSPREGSSFVTGDPVNVAARLEQAAERGEVLVGERTVVGASGAFEFGERRTIEAKGKPGGIVARPLLRALSLTRPRGVGGLQRAFVGRAHELSELERMFDGVVESQEPRLVTVLGDVGVGKTRLMREFWAYLGDRLEPIARRTGRCLPYGRGITYRPLGDVLKEHLGILDSDSQAATLTRLGSREILGLTLGLDVAHGLHPLAARDRFQDAWIDFVSEVVAEQPAVLLIEDIHWADEQLLNLLERLVRDTHGPLLLVVTARPELLDRRPGWGSRVRSERVTVEALSAQDSARMLGELLGGALPAGLGDVIVEHADGNPFFVEELLATFIDRGLLTHVDGSWSLSGLPADFVVPDTVQAVVAARIDLLDSAEKRALQAASVIGRIFWASPVYELVPDVEPDLHVLEERDFIRRRPASSMAGQREFNIKHALTREVAYASLPRARRARLHASFAGWLDTAEDRLDEHASLLAHHYAEAVRPDVSDLAWAGEEATLRYLRGRALAWTRLAAELAIGRFEIDDGIALLHRALKLGPDRDDQVALWREIGRANTLKYDGEAFWTAMQRSLEGSSRATAADTYSELALNTALRSSMWLRHPDPDLIKGWIDQALAMAETTSAARAKALLAGAFLDAEGGEDSVREARELADRLGRIELRAWALEASKAVADSRGDYEEGYAWIRRARALLSALTDPDHVTSVVYASNWAALLTGRFDDALRYAMEHEEASRSLTPHHRIHALKSLINVEFAAGRWQGVRALTARAESAVAANRATPCGDNEWSLLACALASYHLGAIDEAGRLEEVAASLGMTGYSLIDSVHLELAIARDDLPDVARRLDDLHPGGLMDAWSLIAQQNALVALERRADIEQTAPRLLIAGSYLEPFALRALGYARHDGGLIDQAAEKLALMGATWHADQTRQLLVSG